MAATPKELVCASELRSALAELNNAAIETRPIVEAEAEAYLDGSASRGTLRAVRVLERLDAALADAGEVLERAAT